MPNEPDYIERTLLKLRREYSKDEVLSGFVKELCQKDVEIGKLKSEIEYLANELQYEKEKNKINENAYSKFQNIQNTTINQQAQLELRKNELYNNKINECNAKTKLIKQLRNTIKELINKSLTTGGMKSKQIAGDELSAVT